jgi:hypothetical protein
LLSLWMLTLPVLFTKSSQGSGYVVFHSYWIESHSVLPFFFPAPHWEEKKKKKPFTAAPERPGPRRSLRHGWLAQGWRLRPARRGRCPALRKTPDSGGEGHFEKAQPPGGFWRKGNNKKRGP